MLTVRLKEPPIVEVVCGFAFDPVPAIDPVAVGDYWRTRRSEDFSSHELRSPVAEGPGLRFAQGVGPLRTWLVSRDDEYVLQVQPDRLYFNWRKRDGGYPHFRDEGDEKEGILSRSLREYSEFASFAKTSLGTELRLRRVELAKIDMLLEGRDFSDPDDLAQLVPAVAASRLAPGGETSVTLSLVEEVDGCRVLFQMQNHVPGPKGERALHLESRASREAGTDLRDGFTKLNAVVNGVFFGMVKGAGDGNRFGGIKP